MVVDFMNLIVSFIDVGELVRCLKVFVEIWEDV